MRKVVSYLLLSLDGVAESPDRYVFDFDDAMYANLAAVIDAQDTVLLGRLMYDEWSLYWPEADDEPFASFINGVEKFVATSRPLTSAWSNASRIEGDLFEFVRDLKQKPGKAIGVHGSVELARSLFEAGLVDELRLVIAPVVAGSGRRFFASETELRRLELVEVTGAPTGALMVGYRVHTSG
ncbi:MAG: dihydrofolate reductase family protein [Nocardioidaceae bacterium]